MSRQKPGALLVHDLPVKAGDAVDIALTAGRLAATCAGVFGPTIAWMLVLAVLGGPATGLLGAPLGAAIGVAGIFMALLMGARSGRKSALQLAEQVRVRQVSQPMPDMRPLRK